MLGLCGREFWPFFGRTSISTDSSIYATPMFIVFLKFLKENNVLHAHIIFYMLTEINSLLMAVIDKGVVQPEDSL